MKGSEGGREEEEEDDDDDDERDRVQGILFTSSFDTIRLVEAIQRVIVCACVCVCRGYRIGMAVTYYGV